MRLGRSVGVSGLLERGAGTFVTLWRALEEPGVADEEDEEHDCSVEGRADHRTRRPLTDDSVLTVASAATGSNRS
jgi:hypothetical protein